MTRTNPTTHPPKSLLERTYTPKFTINQSISHKKKVNQSSTINTNPASNFILYSSPTALTAQATNHPSPSIRTLEKYQHTYRYTPQTQTQTLHTLLRAINRAYLTLTEIGQTNLRRKARKTNHKSPLPPSLPP